MEQTAWAAIGLLAVFVLGMVPVFLIEIRALGGRIDRLDEKMDRRFDRVDERFDRTEAGVNLIDAKLTEHVQRHAG